MLPNSLKNVHEEALANEMVLAAEKRISPLALEKGICTALQDAADLLPDARFLGRNVLKSA